VVRLYTFGTAVIGATIPLGPRVLGGGRAALPLSWALSIAVLLRVAILKGVLTGRPLLGSGLEFASVALGSAVVGWLVGTLFDRVFGVTLP
jgi:VIT1/CCC1 family predicted Fe2+/Mn2+ transporter